MSEKRDMRDLSRVRWASDSDTLESINTGSLLRIADGVESMAKGYVALEQRAKSAESGADYWKDRAEAYRKAHIAQKGQITKLRNKLAAMLTARKQGEQS
jgi:hypothetical protein